MAWEGVQERRAGKEELDDEWVTYHHDLSMPQGCRVGGFPSWYTTDPSPMNCEACAAPTILLITVSSREWDGRDGSWMPVEEGDTAEDLRDPCPTKFAVGRDGLLNVFACPTDPGHPHRFSVQ
ncbi:hypothetical protein OG206_22920 [Streptomyces sp. NBC_01341]|uniref:hypothetical protein n=1 Tax=Streptomyces sp. NBC_01341 TaxID=2903831 RepID=UPI002E15537E|nr:hypothetical protein OG206_22920 [Streptomyces sp. NBC_01341]